MSWRERLAEWPRPSGRAVLGAIALLGVVAAWLGGPAVLRRLEFFRVRQIELVGVRHLSPDAVITALRLPSGASVWDDRRAIERRLRGLPGVADARVVRRLPGALKVLVREVTPVAFVPGPRGLAVVDAAARPLPFDPARSALDLPVAATADTAVIAVLARVQETDPALFRDVTAARGTRGAVVLELGARRLLLRSNAGPEVIRGVVLVQQDLAARGRPYQELDARYAGQVVVRRKAA
jgi:cell division septal protein FtsQ